MALNQQCQSTEGTEVVPYNTKLFTTVKQLTLGGGII